MKWTQWVLSAILLSVPLATWLYYKPIRALTPQLVGLTCVRDTICVDDVAGSSEASMLYDSALEFVASNVGSIGRHPKIIFCATDSCYEAFGLHKPTAHTTPFGIIVSPRGWLPHYLRHEMIHHLQIERLGYWKLGPIERWRSPAWFIEGITYSLGKDPRPVLIEPNQTYRLRFEEWYRSVGKERLWEMAQEL